MLRLQLILSCVFIFVNSGFGQVSPEVGMTRFYKELGCKLKSDGGKYPPSYECPSFAEATEKTCLVKGKTYQIGDKIPAEPGACLAACVCQNPFKGKRAQITCANIECPEHLGVPLRPHCSRTYSLDKCCATGYLCDEAAKSTPVDPNDTYKVIYKSAATATCNVGGKKYDEHSKYYPDELPCSRCVCMKGHDGTNKAPWCTDISCNLELRNGRDIHEGCAPVFIETSRCCPLQFRCPAADDQVIHNPSPAKPLTEGPQCTFGKLKLFIGEQVTPPLSDPNMRCSCEVPPFVSCSKATF
ncbi:hypothetical protein M8J76_004757 [Diaphorina citri]|nr:hypothetical protein M8J76_004757 [Diaphorina citri]